MLRMTVNQQPVTADNGKPTCPICGQAAKLNEMVRSAHHVLGCLRCYVKDEDRRSA